MKPSTVKCDGCGEEVHDDLVEIVGDEVLCARCRRTRNEPIFPFEPPREDF